MNKADVTPNPSRGTLAARDTGDHQETLETREARYVAGLLILAQGIVHSVLCPHTCREGW